MPPTIIQVAQETSESAAFAKADAVKYTTGSTLYFEGLPTEDYSCTGLTVPHNTSVLGDGIRSRIAGNPTINGTVGLPIIQQVVFVDGCTPYGIRSTVFFKCGFLDVVSMTGPCYQSGFDWCYWDVLGTKKCLTTVDNNQNNNWVTNSKVEYESGTAFDLSCPEGGGATSNGWSFRNMNIEGNNEAASDAVLGCGFKIAGRSHNITGIWFERGASRTYSPNHVIELMSTSYNCEIGTCEWGALTTILNEGTNNIMPPYLVGLGGRIFTS